MKTSLLRCSAFALLVAHAFAAAPAQTALDRAALAPKVDAIAAEFLARPGGVGLSIAVACKGEVLLERGYGLADAEFDVQADANTLFRIGSVTKQFTAAAVLRAVEHGDLALDDDLSEHVPSFELQGRKVTIAQLLTHTSGIVSYTDLEEEWSSKWPLELKHDELLALVEDLPFAFEPGTQWAYNNTGYYLLGMVLEKVAGKPYAELMHEQLFAPLGLAHTRYDSNTALIKHRAQGYALTDGALCNDQALGMSQPGAAGGLLSTGGDLVRWSMLLTAGKVVSPEFFARMSTPTVLPDGSDTHYGFGLSIGELDGLKRIDHGGGIFGFNSMLAWYPDADVHVAVISNGETVSSAKIADAIAYAALGISKRVAVDLAPTPELIAKLVGDYSMPKIKLDARIFERDSKLFVQATGQDAFRVLWQGGDEFCAEFDHSVRLVFSADGRGFTLHQGGGVAQASRK